MDDYFEIDFLDIESSKSGDAITLRYRLNGTSVIHIVDGGFQDVGKKIVKHVQGYYDYPSYIDHVVATHPDGDHAGGLRTVLQEFRVGALWMLRPWLYADEIIHRFSRFTSVDNLRRRLKEIYPNIAALEAIAIDRNIPIHEPFQGANIGIFKVMAPTKSRYLDLIVESEQTPESVEEKQPSSLAEVLISLEKAAAKAISFIKAAWGVEVFSPEETSAENEMSVIQYATLCGYKILLTADAGRSGLMEAAEYAPYAGLTLPGIDRFQIPHHGSRRNVSTEILDIWLGPRSHTMPLVGEEKFQAFVSSAKDDKDHPRKSVVRAFIHRGGKVFATEGKCLRTEENAPPRHGWVPAPFLIYPEEQEE